MPVTNTTDSLSSTDKPPVIVIGNGPVGYRTVLELLKRSPKTPVIVYGEEQHAPYNRVQLSTWLAGDVRTADLSQPLQRPFGTTLQERFGTRVTAIHSNEHSITDSLGNRQEYSKLIIATGSSPHIPDIEGVHQTGVYTLRDLDDAMSLLARRARSHHTVVVGAGLLGLEVARAMQKTNTRVTIIEHADRLLSRQIDDEASKVLLDKLNLMHLSIKLKDRVACFTGDARLTGVRLASDEFISCDTVILATGIKPNIQLARESRIAVGRGITVDDFMRTTADDIYAVGECAEHNGNVYGLVAPGFEQAAVAAAHIAGDKGQYRGSSAASRLKVLGTQVFSVGPMGDDFRPGDGKSYTYRKRSETNPTDVVYRKILVKRNRLAGALSVGEWPESVRLQSAVQENQFIAPWQIWRFRRSGTIWPAEQSNSTAAWPAEAIVCQCTGVTRGKITEAIAFGALTPAQVQSATGASSVCGSCKPLVQELLGAPKKLDAPGWSRTLTFTAVSSLIVSMIVLFAPAINYASTVERLSVFGQELHSHWDALWRNGFIKQVTGFSILALLSLGLLISLRKRLPAKFQLGKYDSWRIVHVGLGVAALLLLVAHTGFRLGHGLNMLLMAFFISLILVGSVSGSVIALQDRLDVATANRLRRLSVWMHILLFWPVPVLLGWHVLKGYWY